MTPREHDLLAFLERYSVDHDGVSPSFEEMRNGIGLGSKSGVARILASLQDQGRVRRRPGKVRPYEVVRGVDLSPASDAELLAEVRRRGLIGGAA